MIRTMKVLILCIFLNFSIDYLYSQETTSTWIEDWQKSTVSIGIIDTLDYIDKKIPYYKIIGTGVFFYVKYDTTIIPCLITAKHVFHDSSKNWFPSSVRIRFSWYDDQPVDEYFGFEIELKNDNSNYWFEHPDSEIDLACIPIYIPSHLVELNNYKLPVLPYKQIGTDFDIYEGESILVFGYPGAVGINFHTKAIIRQGIVAWTPPNFDADSKILIDCDIFPGNSGGPVFSYPIGLSRDGKFEFGKEIKFIGIVVERRLSNTKLFTSEKLDTPLTDSRGNLLLSYESIGIGVVIPSTRIRELLVFTQKEIERELISNSQ